MADTIIPPPDPTKPVQPTFDPAPVTTPAPSASPAATPSANGLAAPGAQPAANATAPAASGQAGVNPTTAGNNAPTQGKDALSTLATPAPLPAEAKTQPAPTQGGAGQGQPGSTPAKPSPNVGPNGVSGANGASGLNPGGPSGATTKTTAKTGNAATLDMLAPVNDTIKKMIDGEDPIQRIQFNQILTAAGPRNQALLQGLGMKLKQNNLDGQGAGDALLAMMARDNEFSTEQLLANASADSAKRIYDMNLHGFDKAIEIQAAQDKQVREDLSTALSNGQLGAAKDLWGQVYPGIPFDEAAAKAASPQATANFNSRMKLVDQFVAQGNPDQAKAVFDKLAEDMPEMFGFPNDPAAAKAALAGIDFKTEAWQSTLKAQNDATAAARTAALQGDTSALGSAIDQLFSKMTPAAVEGIANSAVKSRSLDEINKILTASGMAPVASTDEASLIDKTQLAKAVKSYDLTKQANATATDNLLDIFAKADPSIGTDPAARQAARAWLDAHVYAIANSSDGTSASVDPSKLNKGDLPPWDVNSPQAYMYYAWPKATFNPDGTVSEYTISDPIIYNQDYKPGDLTTETGREDARLDKAYQAYKMQTPSSDLLPMKEWYYATAGGTKDVNKALLTGSLSVPKDTTPVDPMVAAQGVKDKIATGKPLTDADIETAKTQNLIPAFSSQVGSVGNLLGPHAQAYIGQHPDGNALMDGKLVSVGQGFTIGDLDVGTITVPSTGKTYYVDGHGRWYTEKPQANKKLPATVANPLK